MKRLIRLWLFMLDTRPGITCLMHPDDTDVFILLLSHSYVEIVFFTLLIRLVLFSPSDLSRYSQAISNILQYLLAIFVSCFSINFW